MRMVKQWKIKELEKQVAFLNEQLKEDNRFGLKWIDVPEAFEKESEDKTLDYRPAVR